MSAYFRSLQTHACAPLIMPDSVSEPFRSGICIQRSCSSDCGLQRDGSQMWRADLEAIIVLPDLLQVALSLSARFRLRPQS